MAEFNEIKFKGQVQDYSTLKAGLKRSDLNDVKLQSIFDAIDTANENGVKDGVLDENETKTFMQKIIEFAKGGRDRNFSSKEANKLLQALGLTNLDETNLFGLLNTLSNQSKNIKQTTKNIQNNSNIVEYTDGHTEEIFQDGSKILTVKNGNKTTVTKQDKDGKVISKTETIVENGVETVIEYEGETPKSKTVTDTNNNKISNYTLENGNETLVQEENTQTGDITTYQDGEKTITSKDGTVIVEKDGITTTTSSDGNVTTVNSENSTVTTVKNPEENAETITTEDNDGTITVLNKKDGKNISQTISKSGQTYTVEYDGKGNTKGVVVQNGESPALIAKRFGCKLEDLIAANPDAIKGKAPNQYFLVGADIVIPGEMNAEKFAQINTGRQTKEEAVGKYTQFVQAQQAQIEAEDAELAARKNHRRSFLEQKWNTFEECAIAYYKREGVTNPTKRQIELRIKELQELNPNLKDGEIKGKKIIATFSPETDAQIGAGQQRREATRMERKRKAETATGKTMAQVMHNAIDDHVGGVSESDFQANLKKVSADNVVGLLKQYNEISPDETLIEAIMDETWNSLDTRRDAINKIVNALIQRAENANVSDERQKQAIEACKQELNSYWSLGIGYCQTSKLDGLINNLIGTIDAAEALTNEEKSQMTGNGIDETLNLMNTQVSENTSALNAQLAEDGWCADLYEGLKWCVGSDNLDENVKADLKKYEGYITELQKAEQTGGEAGFKAKFKEIFGVDYDPNLMKGYNKLQSNFAMAQGLTMQKEGFYSEFGSCINGKENYSSMRTKYGQYLAQIAQAEGQNIDANIAVDNVIATQLQKQGLDINTATDAQKHQALKTVISDTYNAIDAELNKYTQGRSLSNMEKQLKNAGSAVFGNKNDIAFRINDYISSQQQGGAAVNMAIKAAGAIAVGIATGGAGFAALATTSLATAAISAGVDLTDRVSSEIGLKEGEISNILKNATIDGASVFAGGMVGKYAAMFKNANSFVQAGGKLSMMMAGDVATGAVAEYLQTGTITLEGVAFQAVFSAAGNLVSLKQLAKTDVPTTTSGDAQQVKVSRGVKGDVNNHRDIIADGEVARNADQAHLNANERRIVEEGLEDVPTSEDLAKYQRENGYQPVPEADQPTYQNHQEQVAADYANAHRVENNAVITEQKAPTVPKEAIDNLNDEIRGIDGSIRRLEQQITGAKRFGKNTEALEKQLSGLQQKRAIKMAELEAIQKPKVEIVSDNADVEAPEQVVEINSNAKVKSSYGDFTPITTINDAEEVFDRLVTRQTNTLEGLESDTNVKNPTFWDYGRSYWLESAKSVEQGTKWKIHLYANDAIEYANVAELAIPYLKQQNYAGKLAFKSIRDIEHLEMLRNSSKYGDAQTGKAFTIYFKNEDDFIQTARELEELFDNSGLKSSGKVKNEAQIGESGFVSYRNELEDRLSSNYKPADVADPLLNSQKVGTPEVKPSAEVKSDVTPESVRQSAKNISDAEIPIEHKGLWNDCKSRINSITDELKNFKGDIQAMLLKCENLFADLKVIASKATASVKNKIEQLIEDLRSMLTPKNLPNVDEALTPSVTSQHRMEMGQIGSSIPRAKNLDDLNKLQTWLDQMPESSQKTHLQNQLNAKYAEISAPKVEISQIADYSNSKQGTRLPKNKPVTLQGSETLRLANYDLDLSSPEIQSKLNAMKDGDVITVGRNATDANDIKIDGSFITVSGKHLQIEKVGNRFVVTDLSTNGTAIGKSIAHVSGEIKTTFGHQTVSNLADLKPGQATSFVKGDVRYTIENNNGQIIISSKTRLTPTLNNAIKFDEIRMSNRTPNGKANPGKTMDELLTPQQKKVYSDSMDAFERSKNRKITHNANNVLTTDNMLHGTDIDALLSSGGILDNGLVPREISGHSAAHFADGSVPDTLTPLCSDVWDIRQNATIKDYFDANNSHWNNYGESNFLPNSDQMASSVVIVFDKKSIDPTIIDNSFGVNASGKSILFENGNMSRGHNYPTHRAIPIGAPANSIDRIIIDTRRISSTEVQALRQKINSLGLDVKLYDLNGNLLS